MGSGLTGQGAGCLTVVAKGCLTAAARMDGNSVSCVMQIALSNLDTVLLEARGVFESIEPHVLADMEEIQKAQFEHGNLLGAQDAAERSLLSRRPTAAQTQPGEQPCALL